MATKNLTAKSLRNLLHYNPKDGVFTRLVSNHYRWKVGEVAGYNSGNRRVIGIGDGTFLASRLAWLYVTGKWPKHNIDHRDGNPFNNSFENLRDVTQAVNVQNRHGPTKANKTGILGVMRSSNNRFVAQVGFRGKSIHIGTFDTPEEAHAAYLVAKRKIHEGCTL